MNTKFIEATEGFFARNQSKKRAVFLFVVAFGTVLMYNIIEINWVLYYITYLFDEYLFQFPQAIFELFELLFTDYEEFVTSFDWHWSVLVESSWNTLGEPALLSLGCGAVLVGLLMQSKRNTTWLLFCGYALLTFVCFGNVLCQVSYLFFGLLTGEDTAFQMINANYLFWFLILMVSFFVVAMQVFPKKKKVPHNVYFIGTLAGCLSTGIMCLWQTGGIYVIRSLINGEHINIWMYLESYLPYCLVIFAMGVVLFGTLIYAPDHFETE
ncbi:MAG: hypothetical protein IKU10_04440 [Clostridia bacterium]|nr:hypothetical protein [Clostridia bacterium]